MQQITAKKFYPVKTSNSKVQCGKCMHERKHLFFKLHLYRGKLSTIMFNFNFITRYIWQVEGIRIHK